MTSSTSSSSSAPTPFEVDLSPYPPPPVLWLTNAVDTLCGLPLLPEALQCSEWRDAWGVPEGSGLAHKVPSLFESLPKLETYAEYSAGHCSSSAPDPAPASSANNSAGAGAGAACLYRYAFETPSTALGDLSTPEACLTLLLLVGLLRGIKSVLLPLFRSLGRRAGRAAHGPDWDRSSSNEVRIEKFGEYVFRLLYHSAISVFGVVYFWDKEWWKQPPDGTLSLFAGFPFHPVEPGMTWYYLLQSAYNLDALLSLLELSFTVQWNWNRNSNRCDDSNATATSPRLLRFPLKVSWSPNVRGDFKEMCVHHIITNVLVVGSSRCRLTRIGSMVFLVHDLSDVPVDLSKLANFLKYKLATVACFVTMVLLWTATRLYVLPFTIYTAVLTQSHYVLQTGTISPLLYISYRHPFYVLIALLILLHLAWFGVFMQIFYTLVTKNEAHDYSEHKGGEDCHKPTSNSANGPRDHMGSSPGTALTKNETKLKRRYPARNRGYADEKKDE